MPQRHPGPTLTPMPDKPLHVQVAEALGCTPVFHNGYFYCPCNGKHGQDPDDLDCFHYDTDWAPTGPLIEKYKIGLEEPGKNGGWNLWTALYHYRGGGGGGAGYEHGETPLTAVCHLILALGKAGKL